MSNLHAQLALFGAIDEVVNKTNNPEVVAIAETFLPRTTGPGQRGWYGELKQFLNQKQLLPHDDDGGVIPREGPVQFPDYRDALAELAASASQEPDDDPRDAGQLPPDIVQRSLYASMILSQMDEIEPVPIRGFVDPLTVVLQFAISSPGSESPSSSRQSPRLLPPGGPIAEAAPPPPPLPPEKEQVRQWLLGIKTREAYADALKSLPGGWQIDPDAGVLPPPCTGALRKVGGQFCTVLTTDWDQPFMTLERMTELIAPENWPRLCNFFVGMTPQEAVQPDRSRGWSRMLETVSGDRTQWEMRTALKFWKGASPAVDGIYLNYDLDSPRMNDDKLVEVDSGYIWITPKVAADPTQGVRVRTSKAVRIRGLSATATAALGCVLGWGDAASQMLKEPKKAIADLTPFPPPSEEPDQKGPAPGNDTATPAANDLLADAEILAAAEEVELPAGWRGTLIENISKEFVEIIKVSAPLSTELIDRWLDGMSDDDVREFGTTAGSVLTDRAVAMFTAAANAVQPRPDEAQTTGGQNP